ncbi:EpsG family protein [Moellerella wisconsensis]|uniref:EpsG family protein n=1 Tax=Moellerella wisconsensis TaxID=158849 RepID=UPI001F4E5AEE|nr:EpsG family protein [Moellerella wisconsensis]UNH41715.1 EpsG family protein [Moellerella wisconsensis]
MIYYLLFGYFSLLAIFCSINNEYKWKRNLTIISAIIIIFISGIRWKTGTDWEPYFKIFNNNLTFFELLSLPYETGFLLLNSLVKLFTNNYTLFLFTSVIIIVSTKYYTILKLSPYPLVALLANMSFYAADLFHVRQGFAISIVALSSLFIVKKKPLYFTLLVLLASSFHITALSFIPAYYIYNLKFKVSKVFTYLFIAFFVSLFIDISTLLLNIANYLFPFISEKIIRYTEMDFDVASDIPLWVRQTLGFTKRMFFIFIFISLSSKIKNDQFKGFLNIFIVSVFIFIILNEAHPTFKRIAMYYSFFEIILISYILVPFKLKSRIIIILLIILYCYSKYIYGFESNWPLFFPYESIFDTTFKYVY